MSNGIALGGALSTPEVTGVFASVRPTPDDCRGRRRFYNHSVGLSTSQSYAVAQLVDVLAIGEDSAVRTFEYLAQGCDTAELAATLRGIAADESRHRLWLADLRQLLPDTMPDVDLRRRFG